MKDKPNLNTSPDS